MDTFDTHLHSTDEPYNGLAPCPHCFESCGYVCEFGNDWNDGPYVHQTRIPCRQCDGLGYVEAEPITFEDLVNESNEALARLDATLAAIKAEQIVGRV